MCGAEVGEMNGVKQRGSSEVKRSDAESNGTNDERMNEVNEPTASTLPSNKFIVYFLLHR